MHRTKAGEKRKTLLKGAHELEKEARNLRRITRMDPAAKIRQDEADRLKAEAEDLKRDARLEDLHVWRMEKTKTTKSDCQSYGYWMATWREGGKVRNVHLGSCRAMDKETAMQKARRMKADAIHVN
jgi:regulator of replication initiation timing